MHVTDCVYVCVRVKASCRVGSLLPRRSRDQAQADCQAHGQAPLPRHVLALIHLLIEMRAIFQSQHMEKLG